MLTTKVIKNLYIIEYVHLTLISVKLNLGLSLYNKYLHIYN